MVTYFLVFSKDGKDVCCKWQRAASKDEAMLDAEFGLICRFPNVEYDDVRVEAEEE